MCNKSKERNIYDHHLKTCEYRLVECKAYGLCQKKVYTFDLRRHENECDFIEVFCSKCEI